jgi:preprotein translocase subunit SecG
MYTFLVILFVLVSFSLVVVILLQAGKGQGLAGSIGGGPGSNSIFGSRGAADFLSKATTWMAAMYMIIAILIGMIYKTTTNEVQKSLIQKKVEEQQAMPMPNIPVAPVQGQQQQPQQQPENNK